MREYPKKDRVLPDGWLKEFFNKADMAASYAALSGCTHFHTESLRGLIRSIELRPREAREHFQQALKLSQEAPKTVPNLMRQVLLGCFRFEHRLLEGPLKKEEDVPKLEFPAFSPEVVKEYPEIKVAERLRLTTEGLVQLHLGGWRESCGIFEEILEKNRHEREEILAPHYLNLAVSQYNLGEHQSALRNIENSGFCAQVGGSTLNRVRIAGNLWAIYKCIEERDAAAGWRAFLEQLDCPEATKDAFLRRNEILVVRWVRDSVLLPV